MSFIIAVTKGKPSVCFTDQQLEDDAVSTLLWLRATSVWAELTLYRREQKKRWIVIGGDLYEVIDRRYRRVVLIDEIDMFDRYVTSLKHPSTLFFSSEHDDLWRDFDFMREFIADHIHRSTYVHAALSCMIACVNTEPPLLFCYAVYRTDDAEALLDDCLAYVYSNITPTEDTSMLSLAQNTSLDRSRLHFCGQQLPQLRHLFCRSTRDISEITVANVYISNGCMQLATINTCHAGEPHFDVMREHISTLKLRFNAIVATRLCQSIAHSAI